MLEKKEKTEVRIRVIGESGVGKSKWISSNIQEYRYPIIQTSFSSSVINTATDKHIKLFINFKSDKG